MEELEQNSSDMFLFKEYCALKREHRASCVDQQFLTTEKVK